ncbi:MAG: non-heme iron oxygenase ferredoxin subunit [Anaerolineales bacterium]|nr:non-heme iron oxygenase ferredoxin subunit [Anaerolineales bacterium]
MGEYVTVATVNDVKKGKVKTFVVNGKRIALCNVQGTFFATQDLCTHDGGPLGEGELWDYNIECPRHGGRFDVRTGQVTALPPMFPIKTFPVRVEGDNIQVALD